MGFSLNNLVKRVGNDLNPFDGPKQAPQPASTAPRTQAPQPNLFHQFLNANQQIAAPIAHQVNRIATLPGRGLVNAAHAIPNAPNTNPIGRGINSMLINPVKTTDTHFGQALQGQNPYHGSIKQQLGQAGQDALNVASIVPIGKGAEILAKGAPLAAKVAQGAKLSAKAGAGFGGAQGLTSSLQNNSNFGDTIKNIGVNAAIDGFSGAAFGTAVPLAGRAITKSVPIIGDAIKSGSQNIAANHVPLNAAGTAKPFDNSVGKAIEGKLAKADNAPATTTKLVPPSAATPTTSLVPKEVPVVGQSGSLGNDTAKVVDNALSGKVAKQNLSPETQALVSGDHAVRNTQNLADTSGAAVDKLPTNTAIEQAHGLIAQPLGHVTDEQTGFIVKAIEKADTAATKARAAGNVVEADRLSRESAALHDGLSEHATARGQANQALTMLYNQSPQGMHYSALKDLKRAGVPDTPELRAKIQPFTDAVKASKDAEAVARQSGDATALKVAQSNTIDAVSRFHQAVSQQMPQGLSDKAIGMWKAGLLSGVKTQQGNAISNTVFKALKKVSDIPAAAADTVMSIGSGKRTIGLTNKGEASGATEGTKNGIHTMRTGLDRRSAGDKYEQHAEINFKNPVLNKTLGKATRTIFRGMNAADQPFWYASFKNSMYDQAKAEALTQNVKFADRKTFMDNLVNNPTTKMADTALKEANKSTLNYDTIGSKAIQGMHTAIDNFGGATPAGKKIAHGVLSVLAPFVRVPTAFLSRTVDFTPLGPIKEAFHQIAGKQFDQRSLSQAIGEGVTGTGVIALGMALTQHNLLSGDYPKNDAKEAARWKAEGITPNSVKMGGKWINLNYFGPVGLLFNAGHQLENSKGQGTVAQAGATLGGLGQGLLGQSFLQGFTGFSDALKDPARNGQSFINSQASSIVPSIVNDVANATDSMQRQANGVLDSVKNRIPVLREQNKPKQDVYGNPLKQAGGQLNTLNGFKPSNSLINNNPAIAEVNRLHRVNPQDSNLQVTPTPLGKSITVESKNVPLNDQQRYDLQTQIGQATQAKWGELIKTDAYKAMDDTQKAAALGNIKGYATEHATRDYVVKNNLGSYTKPESTKAVALYSGTTNIGDLSQSKATGGVSSTNTSTYYKAPDAEYKALQTKYDTAIKDNTYNSPAQKITATKELAKAKAGSSFDKTVRDAYGLSNADLYNYVHNDPNGNKITSDVLAYGDALVAAGVEKKNTFRDKYGNVTLHDGSVSTSSGKSSASRKKTATNKFTTSIAKNNTANASNQSALQNLIKGAKVNSSSSTSNNKKLNVASVALKKQNISGTSRTKRKVIV